MNQMTPSVVVGFAPFQVTVVFLPLNHLIGDPQMRYYND